MKDKAIAIIMGSGTPQSKFNKLLAVLVSHPDATSQQKNYYNRSGYSKANAQNLVYDVKKLLGIQPVDLRKSMKIVEQSKPSNKLAVLLTDVTIGDLDYRSELKPLAAKVAAHIGKEPKSQRKVDLIAFLEPLVPEKPNDSERIIEIISQSSQDEKEGFSLRAKYPFLANEDCPDKLKVLVADKISAYYKLVDGHEDLKHALEGDAGDDLYEKAAGIVSSFELNESITSELDYYNEHGELLMEHPIFEPERLEAKVAGFKFEALAQKKKNLKSNISKDRNKLEAAEDAAAKKKIETKIKARESEIKLIDERIAKGE